MGKAEARDLGLEGGALYDPEVNYRRVKGELWDWADDQAPQQVANDTRSVPAANAGVPEGPPALAPPQGPGRSVFPSDRVHRTSSRERLPPWFVSEVSRVGKVCTSECGYGLGRVPS